MKLNPSQLKFYSDQGYLVVENLISLKDLGLLRARIDETQAAIKEGKKEGLNIDTETTGTLRKLTDLASIDPLFNRIARTSDIIDIVSQLTGGGENILLYNDQAFLKPAHCGSEKPLHQDNSYFKISPNSAGITCWMALDDATISNGCLNYIPGSHKLGLVKHRRIVNTPHLIPDVHFKLDPEIPVPVPAGSCIFHHLLCLHSSKANTSSLSRRAWAIHYANRGMAQSCLKPWTEMLPLN